MLGVLGWHQMRVTLALASLVAGTVRLVFSGQSIVVHWGSGNEMGGGGGGIR